MAVDVYVNLGYTYTVEGVALERVSGVESLAEAIRVAEAKLKRELASSLGLRAHPIIVERYAEPVPPPRKIFQGLDLGLRPED